MQHEGTRASSNCCDMMFLLLVVDDFCSSLWISLLLEMAFLGRGTELRDDHFNDALGARSRDGLEVRITARYLPTSDHDVGRYIDAPCPWSGETSGIWTRRTVRTIRTVVPGRPSCKAVA